MRIIVAHTSPDMDAITSVWLIKKFLPGWDKAQVQFVPAGEAIGRTPEAGLSFKDPVERMGRNRVIHVDTGLGPLDHHQTLSDKVCAASLTFDYVIKEMNENLPEMGKEKLEALDRMVKVVVQVDHFKEVFWGEPTADYHEFSIVGILDGLKLEKPDSDQFYVDYVCQALDALLHEFENRVWAEKEIKEHGTEFNTRFGKGIAFETVNDSVIKLSQKMGYVIVLRKDPRKGYVRIKARPDDPDRGPVSLFPRPMSSEDKLPAGTRRGAPALATPSNKELNLTLAYEKLRKMDPEATWFLHVSKKMLLNGTVKNPKMKPTKLKLSDIIEVLRSI